MCLDLKKNAKVKIAKKDITVYKYVKSTRNEGVYLTPYQNAIVCIGKTYTSELLLEDDTVFEGLHSYAHLKDIIHKDHFLFEEIIVKCVIPKGASYFIGKFSGVTSCASDTLRYVEVMKNKKNTNEYVPGAKVKLVDGHVVGQKYDGVTLLDSMVFEGERTIESIELDKYTQLCESTYVYTKEMLKLIK